MSLSADGPASGFAVVMAVWYKFKRNALSATGHGAMDNV